MAKEHDELLEELLSEFKFLYDDEEIDNYFYYSNDKYVEIKAKSGYVYRVSYNNGNIETECIF
jgi:hypothetical protein